MIEELLICNWSHWNNIIHSRTGITAIRLYYRTGNIPRNNLQIDWNCMVGFCDLILYYNHRNYRFNRKMKKLLIITLLFFCIIGYVSGGENTTIYDDAPIILNDESNKTIVALEDGHLNTSFSNNYNGYCVEYTEQEAKKGDQFICNGIQHISKTIKQIRCKPIP